MIQVPLALRTAIHSPTNQPVDLYELYLDSGPLFYADQNIAWGGNTYTAGVLSRSAIKRCMDGQVDSVSVRLSNVDTGLANILLNNDIEGRRLVVRKIDRTVASLSIVLFDGRMERPSHITEAEATIEANHIIGSIDFDAPARTFDDFCPWDFKGVECRYAGSELACDHSWARCNELVNIDSYGGFRFIPHSGSLQYKQTETARFLLLFRRKKTKYISVAFNAVDDTPYGVPIPIIYGRVQIAGIVIEHEDVGDAMKLLVAFCVGHIPDLFYLRANQAAVTDFTVHHGGFGGSGDQVADARFPHSYPYNLLAYVGMTIPSDVSAVDSAPSVTAVVMGRDVSLFDALGQFIGTGWTDSPVWNTRDFMCLPLAQGGMGIPEDLIDDVENFRTAAYCSELVVDNTNDQKMFSPPVIPEDFSYERYQSTGVDGADPTVDGPYSEFEPGTDDDTSTEPAPVNVKRFTLNVAIAKQEKAVDILFKKLLPSFRGYLTQNAAGKLQIRCERPVKTATLTSGAGVGGNYFLSSGDQFAVGDTVILAPFTTRAELAKINGSGSTWLSLETSARFEHNVADLVVQVQMAFDESNIVRDFEYPLSDQQSSTNRVTIKYVDAPAGFAERELHVNDYDHQAQVHKVNNEDVDGGAIDSYFQAWRIGQWLRAKRRDLGKFCSFVADIKATLLEVGDVIAVSAGEVGLQVVPFIVNEISFEPDDEVSLLCQLYAPGIYDDEAPQCTVVVPTIFPQPIDQTAAVLAPNILGATCTPIYGAGVYGFAGTITLPVSDPAYSHLKTIHVVGIGQHGETLEVCAPIASADFDPDEGGVITWRGPNFPRDGAVHYWRLEFRVANEDGTQTLAPFALTAVEIAPVLVTACSAVDASTLVLTDPKYHARWKDPGLHVVINITLSINSEDSEPVTIWLVMGGRRIWQGWWSVAGEDQVISIGLAGSSNDAIYSPIGEDEDWTVIAAPGRIEKDGTSASELESDPFTVAAPPVPADTWISSAAIDELVYYKTIVGYAWCFGNISFHALLDSAEFKSWEAYVQLGTYAGGVWTPAPASNPDSIDKPFVDGDESTNKGGVTTDGNEVNIRHTWPWGMPGATDTDRTLRMRMQAVSRRDGDTATTQACWAGTAPTGVQYSADHKYAYLTPDITKAKVVITWDDSMVGDGLTTTGGKPKVKTGPGLTINVDGKVVPNLGATVGLNPSGQLMIPSHSLGVVEFGGTVQPYGFYFGLPNPYDTEIPRLILNTADWKVYRNTGGAWTKAQDPADLIAGTITALVQLVSPVIAGGTITGASITLTNGAVSVAIDNVQDSGLNNSYGIKIRNGNARVAIGYNAIVILDSDNHPRWQVFADGTITGYDASQTVGLILDAYNHQILAKDAGGNTRVVISGMGTGSIEINGRSL